MPPGHVTFLGLGPGDPGLYTVRARERLAQADVVVDAPEASAAQLIEYARRGKSVVRAVPGDPLESPSVVAEALEVVSAGVEMEVVPGIGAGSSIASFAGVRGRAVATSATEVEATFANEPSESAVTMVVKAGLPSQKVVVGTPREVIESASSLGEGVAVIVGMGAPQPKLRWFERRPLFGKRVLVTRAREQAARTADLLSEQGAEPLVVPTIEIHPPSDPAPLADALRRLKKGGFEWAVFTSANGVERTWDAIVASGSDARAFGSVRLAAIGPATALALRRHGLDPDLVAKEFRGEGLASDLLATLQATPSSKTTPRVLIARAARARDVLPDMLRECGCKVEVVAAYETHPPPKVVVEALTRELDLGRVDAVTFTSSSTVENLCDMLGARAVPALSNLRVASIGPVTTDTARARGLRVDVTAAEYTVPGLVRALAESYRSPLEPPTGSL